MKNFYIILVSIMIQVSFTAFGYDFEVNDLWYNLQGSGDGVTLVGTAKRSGVLTVPENI